MAYSWILFLEPSTYALVGTALFTIIYASIRSTQVVPPASKVASHMQWTNSQNHLTKWTAIVMPIVGSCVLLLLFFFLNWMFYLLLVFVILVGFIACMYVFDDLVLAVLSKAPQHIANFQLRIPKTNSTMPVNHILDMLLSITLLLVWFFTDNFIPTNILAVCIGITGIINTRLPNMKIAAILLGMFFVYDVFWVFISPFVFKESVMMSVAVPLAAHSLPMAISYPRVLDSGAYSLLGLGDVVLPGLFLCWLRQINTEVKYNKFSYFWIGIAGYCVGFAVTIFVLVVMSSGQPALLYIVPGIFAPVAVAAWSRGELAVLWHGPVRVTGDDAREHRDLEAVTVHHHEGEGEGEEDSFVNGHDIDANEQDAKPLLLKSQAEI